MRFSNTKSVLSFLLLIVIVLSFPRQSYSAYEVPEPFASRYDVIAGQGVSVSFPGRRYTVLGLESLSQIELGDETRPEEHAILVFHEGQGSLWGDSLVIDYFASQWDAEIDIDKEVEYDVEPALDGSGRFIVLFRDFELNTVDLAPIWFPNAFTPTFPRLLIVGDEGAEDTTRSIDPNGRELLVQTVNRYECFWGGEVDLASILKGGIRGAQPSRDGAELKDAEDDKELLSGLLCLLATYTVVGEEQKGIERVREITSVRNWRFPIGEEDGYLRNQDDIIDWCIRAVGQAL